MAPQPAPRQRVGATGSPRVFTHQCALCESQRVTGSLLSAQPSASGPALWVCDDCQHKLSRRVDDEGSLGG